MCTVHTKAITTKIRKYFSFHVFLQWNWAHFNGVCWYIYVDICAYCWCIYACNCAFVCVCACILCTRHSACVFANWMETRFYLENERACDHFATSEMKCMCGRHFKIICKMKVTPLPRGVYDSQLIIAGPAVAMTAQNFDFIFDHDNDKVLCSTNWVKITIA